MHVGHRRVIEALLGEARARRVPSVVLTFHPHPRLSAGNHEAGLLMPLEERVATLRELGVEWVMVMAFTQTVRRISPWDFFHGVLLAMVGATVVIVGKNHRFGAGGAGDEHLLTQMAAQRGVAVVVVPECRRGSEVVSSRSIRASLMAGDVRRAAAALGRPYRLQGIVVKGKGLGRELGYPTANLAPTPGVVVPADGVYAALAHVEGRRIPAVVNVGTAPTLAGGGGKERSIEVHLIDHEACLYGKRMGISFVSRLRDERRFVGLEGLRRQIAVDVGRARALLGEDAGRGWFAAGNDDPSP